MPRNNRDFLPCLIIDANTDTSKLPDVAWVNQGVSAYRHITDKRGTHTHRVFVRSDGYLRVESIVPGRK